MGVIPARIDIITAITGAEFEEAWQQRQLLNIENRQIPVLHRDHLISNKKATGRPKDLGDVAALEAPPKKKSRK